MLDSNPRSDRPKVLSLGEVLWDLFDDGPRFGGAPANFACHAAIRGAEVTMVSAVGDDERGREACAILKRYGVDASLVSVIPDAPTGTVGIELDENGKPDFTIHEGSAWDALPWSPALQRRLTDSDAVYFGTLGQRGKTSRETIRRALEVARSAGVTRVLDINLRPPFFDAAMIRDSIDLASILKFSDDELGEVCAAVGISLQAESEATLEKLLKGCRLDLVVMTRGSEGAIAVTPEAMIKQPGIPTTVRDTVGAGDAFLAAFLLDYLAGAPLRGVLQNACEVAAEVCAHDGAVPEIGNGRGNAEAPSFLKQSKEFQTT